MQDLVFEIIVLGIRMGTSEFVAIVEGAQYRARRVSTSSSTCFDVELDIETSTNVEFEIDANSTLSSATTVLYVLTGSFLFLFQK